MSKSADWPPICQRSKPLQPLKFWLTHADVVTGRRCAIGLPFTLPKSCFGTIASTDRIATMTKTDRSSPNFIRSFFYGLLVASLASLLLLVPFARRDREAFVAGATLSCTSPAATEEDAKDDSHQQLWSRLVTPEAILQAADETRVFAESTPQERRIEYLKTAFLIETTIGDSPGESLARVSFRHPDRDKALALTKRLVALVVESASDAETSNSFARSSKFDTIEVGQFTQPPSDECVSEGRRAVRLASLQLFAPKTDNEQLDSNPDGSGESLLEEAKRKLDVAKKRYRALYDVAGEDSPLVQNMGFEVERLEAIIQKQQFAHSPLGRARRAIEAAESEVAGHGDVPRRSEDDSASQFRFVAGSTDVSNDALRVTIEKPADIIQTIPGSISKRGLTSLLPVAGAVGVLVGWTVSRKRPERPIGNRADVAGAIESPVIGSVFPTRKRPASGKLTLFSLLGMTFLRLGEATLVAFIAFLVFCATTDNNFIDRFLSNPLATYSASVDHHILSRHHSNRDQESEAAPNPDDQPVSSTPVSS